ncbi:MAG: branched-chain amino acid ABC transporter permease [Thermoleophilia bacterium]|nr:branched-chain amino acid ABC transporter permease [Thermoleophilia bacterium]
MGFAVRAGAFVLAVGAIALLPRFISDFRALQLGTVAIFFIALLGLNILTGHAGQISLGHGAFMGIGGYTTAVLTSDFGGLSWEMNDLATVPIAGLVAGVVGFLFGFPALRLAGVYLALATFALAVALPSLARSQKLAGITGGSEGIILPRLPPTGDWLYYVCWSFALPMFVLAWLIVRGRLGRAFRAVRESEIAAVSSGISLPLYKTVAFGISAFYAGVAGALLAIPTTAIFPDTYPVALSIILLTGVVVGGLGSLAGMAIGALFIQFIQTDGPQWLQAVLDRVGVDINETAPGVPSVLYGLLLLAVLLTARSGVAGLLARGVSVLTNRIYHRPIKRQATPSRREA